MEKGKGIKVTNLEKIKLIYNWKLCEEMLGKILIHIETQSFRRQKKKERN